MPIANADGFDIGYNSGWHGHLRRMPSRSAQAPGYYGGYKYDPSTYPYRRCFTTTTATTVADRTTPQGTHYGGPYYGPPAVSIGYYGGWGARWWLARRWLGSAMTTTTMATTIGTAMRSPHRLTATENACFGGRFFGSHQALRQRRSAGLARPCSTETFRPDNVDFMAAHVGLRLTAGQPDSSAFRNGFGIARRRIPADSIAQCGRRKHIGWSIIQCKERT